jgi:proline iminopeptidase
MAHTDAEIRSQVTHEDQARSAGERAWSVAIRIVGWLLVLIAIPAGIFGGVLALVGLAALTESRVVGGIAGAVALVAVTGGLATLGARLGAQGPRMRRWLPRVVTGITFLVVGTATFLLLFAPGPSYTAFPATDDWQSVDLRTGSRIVYNHTTATGRPQATPVILVHGGPGAPEGGLDSVVPALADAGFDVYEYQQVGAGLSARLDDVAAYTVDRQVADLDALRAAIGADQTILVGESWGGTLIANYLAVHSDHVAKAVVSSPGTIWAPAFAETNGLTASGRQDQSAVIMQHPRFLTAYVLLGTVGPDVAHTLLPDRQMDGEFEAVVASFDLWSGCPAGRHPNGEAVRDHQAGVGFWVNAVTGRDKNRIPDPRPALRNVSTPVLVLRSECDYRAWEATREYRDLLPNGVMLTVDDAGHVIADDRPEFYRQAVLAFLGDKPLPAEPYTDADAPW